MWWTMLRKLWEMHSALAESNIFRASRLNMKERKI
jgi:hypothetical protein